MVSNNTLAILIIAAIAISVIGVYVALETATEEGQETGTGTAKVNVVEQPKPPLGYATVNVIEKPEGG
jgi:hypothetical protein